MKKKLHLLFSVLFIISFYFTSTLSAQNPNLQWKKVNKGEFSGDDIVLCSTRDNASNNYVCGYNNSSTFIAKFDNTGANTFSFVYVDSTNSYITPAKLFVDASGNIIMVGSKNTAGIVLPMVIKFNSQGTVLWENIYDNQAYNIIDDAIVDNASNPTHVYYTGRINDSLAVFKINLSTGNLVWKQSQLPTGYLVSRGLDLAYLNGSVYVTGIALSATLGNDALTLKLNSNGVVQYQYLYSNLGNDVSTDILVNSSGDAFIYGVTTNGALEKFYMMRLTTNGNNTWTTLLTPTISGGGNISNLTSIAMAANISSSTFYVLGSAYNANLGTTNEYTFVVTNTGLVSSNAEYFNGSNLQPVQLKSDNSGSFYVLGKQVNGLDLYVAKFSGSGGASLWRNNYPIGTSYNPVDFYLDNASNVYAASNLTRNSINLGDALIVKYSQSGNLVWDGVYDGVANGYDVGEKVFVSTAGTDIYTTGSIANNGSGQDVVLNNYFDDGTVNWETTLDYNAETNNFVDADQDQYNVSYIFYNSSPSNIGLVSKIDNVGSVLYTAQIPFSYGKIKANNILYSFYVGESGAYNTTDFNVIGFNNFGQPNYNTILNSVSGGYTMVSSILYDASGQIYVAGTIYDPLIGGSVVRLNCYKSNGSIFWSQTIPNNDLNNVSTVGAEFDASGNIIVVSKGILTGGTSTSIFVTKYSTAGSFIAQTNYNSNPGTLDFNPVCFTLAPNGDIIVGGSKINGPGSSATITSFNSNLAFNWNYNFPSNNIGANDFVKSVSSNSSYLYATGTKNISNQISSILISKLNLAGVAQWEENYEAAFPGFNDGRSIGTYNDRIYVVGAGNESPGYNNDYVVLKYCDNPRPQIINSSSSIICANQSTTLYTFSPGTHFLWTPTGDTINLTTASQTGTYQVTSVQQDGCSRISDPLQITVKSVPATPNICAVTVDSISTHNILQWDKTSYSDIDHFNIYREDATNIYTPIGSVPFDSLSEYHDYGANPNITTKRYKISAVDTCNVESALSPYHNTLYVTNSGSGQFNWNLYTIENSGNPVTNYLLMRDDLGNGNWQQIGSTAGSQGTLNDPAFASFPAGKWRIETVWGINCSPTRGPINTSRSNIRTTTFNGINNVSLSQNVSLYPNPNNGNFTITFGTDLINQAAQIEVKNILGETIYHQNFNTEVSKQISLNNISSGIYFMEVNIQNQKVVKQITIQ